MSFHGWMKRLACVLFLFPFTLLPLALLACSPAEKVSSEDAGEQPVTSDADAVADPGTAFALAIEAAHGRDAWYSHDAITADLVVYFGGNKVLEGRMTTTPEVGKTRLDLVDGTVAIWDGETAWVSPADAELSRARFHVLTWPYFLAAPMKLRDPGVSLEPKGERSWDGTSYDTALMTFGQGVGDTPDDWYLLYRGPENVLQAMAYIVTYGAEGEPEPHAIVYDGFEAVGGARVPLRWIFYNWSEDEGIHGDPIGEVELSEVEVTTPEAGFFTRPEDAREETLPGG